jgi:hypothetical protein
LTQSEKVNPIWVPNLAFMAPQHKAWPQRPFGLAQSQSRVPNLAFSIAP